MSPLSNKVGKKNRLTSLFLAFSMLVSIQAAPTGSTRSLSKRDLPFLGGVNLAGCDFGVDTSGNSGTPSCPSTEQIAHFVADGVNLFRIPVGWQYLVASNSASTSLDPTFFATYDNLVKTALAAGAYVLIDVHNYARWNGAIIGQGGPSNQDFASLWSLLAKQYASEPKVIFGLMNEPHDLDVTLWAGSVQAAINAIRAAGATTQSIVVPGSGYTNAPNWYSGTDNPLLTVTDPATNDNSLLTLDIHGYLDSDFSGTSPECTSNGVDNLTSMKTFLKANGRRAILSETGGGNTASCITDLGAELAFVSSNSDVFVGFAVWAAGSFATYPSYPLSIVPTGSTDTDLFNQAIKPHLSASTSSVSIAASYVVNPSTSLAGIPTSSSSSSAALSSPPPVTSSSSTPVSPSLTTLSSLSIAKSSTLGSTVKTTSTRVSTATTLSIRSSSTPTSSRTITTAKTSTRRSSSSAAASTGRNYQTYKGALGSIPAPPVYYQRQDGHNKFYVSNGVTYNNLQAALQGSCYSQMNSCQLAANAGSNRGSLTVANCEGKQINACLAAARGTSN